MEANWKEIVGSFMMSLGNDTLWTAVINDTVQQCFSQFSNSFEYDCNNQIPKNLFDIIDCCYHEHFLKCAKWNPNNLAECEYTYKYVQHCFVPKELGKF